MYSLADVEVNLDSVAVTDFVSVGAVKSLVSVEVVFTVNVAVRGYFRK